MSLNENTGMQARLRLQTVPTNTGHMDRAGEMAQVERLMDVVVEAPGNLQLAVFSVAEPDVDEQGFVWVKKDSDGVPIGIFGWNTSTTSWVAMGLSNSKTWDPASIADAASVNTTVTMTGAVLGDHVTASFSLDLQGLMITAYVSAADTVTVVLGNLTGAPIDLASGTLYVRVTQRVHT